MDALARSVDGAACDYLRQMAWTQEDKTGVDDELWRPPKVHRMSAKKWTERSAKKWIERTDNRYETNHKEY